MVKPKTFSYQKEEIFDNSNSFTASILSLPMYPELLNEEAQLVIQSINEFYR